MLKGLGDIGQIMKLQKEFKSVQKRIMKTVMEGESDDGLVSARVNGEYALVDISIDAELIRSGDKKSIEKQVASAVNSAVKSVKDYSAEEMGKLTGGLDIPGLSNFLK